jgi:hypothetical protein
MFARSPRKANSGGRSYQDEEADGLINEGIAAVMGGDFHLARLRLDKAAMLRPGDGRIWLWLSATTADPKEQRVFLERSLAADPNNSAAVRGLKMLNEGWVAGMPAPSAPAASPEPNLAGQQVFNCPQCGGQLAFHVGHQEVTCRFCGYVQRTAKLLAASESEQLLNATLPTTRGHRWAEDHINLACEKCGAVSLLPRGTVSDHCPYCGSNRMVRAPEADDLVEPLLLALVQVDEEKAHARLKTWLSKGGLTPDGLVNHVERIQLQATYFPFWTFDGMVELPWHAEVNEGTSKNPVWVPVNGIETESFDDILLPGLKAQSREEIKKIEPFNLKDLVGFEPQLLAGWPAITYDIPLGQASLQARETVMRRLRPNLYGRVAGGREMRRLDSGAPNWLAVTYKLVLLPLWVGIYTYQGQERRVLINGQTGKVSGARPRNYFKLLEVSLAAILAALILFVLLSIGLSFLPK